MVDGSNDVSWPKKVPSGYVNDEEKLSEVHELKQLLYFLPHKTREIQQFF